MDKEINMRKTVLYDATLLVNAYETNLFRTGLYRVCSELLLQILRRTEYHILLYDVYGRERMLRQYIVAHYPNAEVWGVESVQYQRCAYPFLHVADAMRYKQTHSKGIKSLFYKSIKAVCLRYASCCKALFPNKDTDLNGIDAYISTYYPIPTFVQKAPLRRLLIVHDLIPLVHPEYFPSDANQQLLHDIIESVHDKDAVVCVSNATRNDFLKYRSDYNSDCVSVAHLAGKECFRPKEEKDIINFLQHWGLDGKPFILSVCTIEPRKNLKLLLTSYKDMLRDMGANAPKLVLTGAYGWKSESLMQELEQINRDYPNAICLTGYISDDELAVLYTATSAFVYPSLYEGFGLPPLEAMQCGAPVIVSNSSSLPEVVEEAGWKISPDSVQELKEAIMRVLKTDKNILRVQSLSQAAKFSWKRTAEKILMELNNG